MIRKESARRCFIWIALAAVGPASLLACQNTAPPTPPPPLSEAVSSADTVTDADHICYAYVVESEPFLMGFPNARVATYASRDGTVQNTSELLDDKVLSLKQGRLEVHDLFEGLDTSGLRLPTMPLPAPGPVTLSEGSPARLDVDVTFCGGHKKIWFGSPPSVPAPVQELVQVVTSLAEKATPQKVSEGDKFIRSTIRKPEEVRFFQDLVIDVSAEQLEASPLLRRAVDAEHRLIRVPSDEAPYVGIERSYKHGPIAEVRVGENVFQIRHLTVVQQ